MRVTFLESLLEAGVPAADAVRVVRSFFGLGASEFPIGELIDGSRRERLIAENEAVAQRLLGVSILG